MQIIFNHAGGIGDILYSLYFITEYINFNQKHVQLNLSFNLNLQCNLQTPKLYNKQFDDNTFLSVSSANFIKPLVESTKIFNNVYIDKYNDLKLNNNEIIVQNLNNFRKIPINFGCSDIRSWYYNMFNEHLPQEFEKPVLININKNLHYNNKIVIIYTPRYQNMIFNPIIYKMLNNYKEHLIFLGTEAEHNEFKEKYFDIEYVKVKDALDAAEIINGSIGLIGNASGLFAIAECLKCPRILLNSDYVLINHKLIPGIGNVHSIGGWYDIPRTIQKFQSSLNDMLKLKDKNE